MLILEQNIQRDRFGLWLGRCRIRNGHGKMLTRFDPGGTVGYLNAVPANLACLHQRLKPGA